MSLTHAVLEYEYPLVNPGEVSQHLRDDNIVVISGVNIERWAVDRLRLEFGDATYFPMLARGMAHNGQIDNQERWAHRDHVSKLHTAEVSKPVQFLYRDSKSQKEGAETVFLTQQSFFAHLNELYDSIGERLGDQRIPNFGTGTYQQWEEFRFMRRKGRIEGVDQTVRDWHYNHALYRVCLSPRQLVVWRNDSLFHARLGDCANDKLYKGFGDFTDASYWFESMRIAA